MKRTTRSLPFNDTLFRYEVKITGDLAPASGIEGRNAQLALLKTCTETFGMLDCGPHPFKVLRMHHDGSAWVIELEQTGS